LDASLPSPNIFSIASGGKIQKAVRLTEFNSCGGTSTHMVNALTAKIEFCKPDPNTWNAGA
jgi:hypothetical protein